MIHRDDRLSEAVEQAVEAIERRTDAEIVVVIAPRCGRYADVPLRIGITVAFAAALVLEFVPWAVSMPTFLAEVGISGVLAGWIAARPTVLGRLLSRSRAADATAQRARAAFVDEAVHGTPRRTGVLVLVGVLEQRVEVVPDLGVEGHVPHGALDPVVRAMKAGSVPELVDGLHALGEVLAIHLPHRPDSDDIDLPNAPRILS